MGSKPNAWLLVKASVFTRLVPATVVVVVPYLLLENPSLGAVDVWGMSIAARDSEWLGLFPTWYSVLAAIVYGGFARFLKTRTVTALR